MACCWSGPLAPTRLDLVSNLGGLKCCTESLRGGLLLTKYPIPTERLSEIKRPTKHGLEEAAGIDAGKSKQGSRQSLESSELRYEFHSEVRLRLGVDEGGATVEGEEGEELQPGGATLLLVVGNGLHPDAMPKDAHHDRSSRLSINKTNRDRIDEGS